MWLVFLIIGLVIVLCLALLCLVILYVRNYWKYMDIPHDPPKPVREVMKSFFSDGPIDTEDIKYYNTLYDKYKGTGPFCGFYHVFRPRALILDPELIKQILIKDFSNFNDRGEYYNLHNDPLSGSLYNICDNEWHDMRKRLDNYFVRESMRFIYNSLVTESGILQLAFEMALQGQLAISFDAYLFLDDYILKSIARSVFGLDDEMRKKYPLDKFQEMTKLALTTHRHEPFVYTLMRRYRKTFRKMGFASTNPEVQKYFTQLLTDVVQYRQTTDKNFDDFLEKLLLIMDEERHIHESDTDDVRKHLMDELIAHAFTFLRSGYQNTTETLRYVLFQLSLNKPYQERVRQEIQQVLIKYNNDLNYDCIKDLKFLGQVISETIRLHPIQPYLIRRTLRNFVTPGYPNYILSKDMYVIIPTYSLHNDPSLYPHAQTFYPERFNSLENQKRAQQCLWLGYGMGPRKCIGLHFSQMLIRLAVARLLLKYDLAYDASRFEKGNVKLKLPLYVTRLQNRNSEFRESIVI